MSVAAFIGAASALAAAVAGGITEPTGIATVVAVAATVIAYATMFGTARQADEGTAAHIWQLLMAGQVPVIAFFAIKWLPTEPRRAVLVLALQAAAALAALFPVWWFQW